MIDHPRSSGAAIASVVGSVLWIGCGVLRFAGDQLVPLPRSVVSWLGPMLLLIALVAWFLPIARLQRHAATGTPRLSWSGFGLACAGLVLALAYAGQQLLDQRGNAMLPPSPLLGTGLLLLNAGLIVTGSALLQSIRPRSWQSLPLMIGLLGLFLPVGAGVRGAPGLAVWSVFGLGWAWLGLVLWLDAAAKLEPRAIAVRRDRR